MSLKNDIDEIIKEWKTSSKWFKIIVIISAFITLSSLASLSDTVFAWKGFILDGIEFYHLWIVEPLKKIFSHINFRYKTEIINFFFIYTTLISSFFRLSHYLYKKGIMKKIHTIRFHLVFIFAGIFIIFHYNNEKSLDMFSYTLTCILSLVYFFLVYISRKEKKAFITLTFPILFSIITILILAAINAGLTR